MSSGSLIWLDEISQLDSDKQIVQKYQAIRPTSLTCQMFLVFSFSSLFMSKAKAVLYVFDFIQILQSEHSFV